MMRSQKPCTLSVGGFYSMSLSTFVMVSLGTDNKVIELNFRTFSSDIENDLFVLGSVPEGLLQGRLVDWIFETIF